MRALLRWLFVFTMSIGLFMLLAAGCGRSSLELEDFDASASSSGTSGTSGNPAVCGPSTCSNGCCDSNGQCQTGRNARACGVSGATCKDCVVTGFDTCTDARVCARTVKNCGPSNCPNGCCAVDGTGNEQCLSGTEATACGLGGGQCVNCEDDGRACDLSTRSCGTTRCDATNCSGCCVGDLCLPGNSQFACGANGGQCGRCNTGEVCRITSVGGGKCETVQQKCGPANCGGCCTSSGQCLGGLSDGACGRLGQACDVCAANESCTPDGLPGARTCQPDTFCGPNNCDGCCVGDVCVPAGAQNDDFCGIKGQQCISCGANQTCNPAGFCENLPDECGPDNCDGCCVGDVCARGFQNTACGSGGEQCVNCRNQNATCNASRTCEQTPVCNAQSCPTGCCQGNKCVPGTVDTQCGGGGLACEDCTLGFFPLTCKKQTCVETCGPDNCNGCCDATGQCVGGISSAACGQFGDSCDNCTARGSFCNGLVSPRACNDEQTECPSPYGTCPAGTATPQVKEVQNVCSSFDLDDIASSCADPESFTCQLIIGEKSADCQDCISNFTYPFAKRTGLFACAATFVTGECRQEMGCTTDCDQSSCELCSSSSTETSCYTLVNGTNGQCNPYASQTSCASSALQGGELCSQFSYPDYGSWLREVGGHFCGDGK